MNTINKKFLSKQSKESKINIRVVLNTFSGNSLEYDQSNELIRILNSKKIKISEILDINQEMIFDKERKVKINIREHYHKIGKLFKINFKFQMPQLIINESLVLSFYEFTLLNESRLLDKILNGSICEHIRIFDNKIVYPQPSENSICIYCYSQKKKKQLVTVICNQRDYNDETNDEIFSFCEKNELTLKIVDYFNSQKLENNENLQEYVENKEKCLIIEEEIVPFCSFYDVLEKRLYGKVNSFSCISCGFKLDTSLGLKKCFECLMTNKTEELIDKTDRKLKNSQQQVTKNKGTNTYNFIEKLQLRKNKFNY